jgi:hypothetical protein
MVYGWEIIFRQMFLYVKTSKAAPRLRNQTPIYSTQRVLEKIAHSSD